MPLVSFDRVSLAFGQLPLFDGCALQIDRGERVSVVGRNGSGKSTLLRVVSGEQPPDTGSVSTAPGLRLARLDQDVPLSTPRAVFDVVAFPAETPLVVAARAAGKLVISGAEVIALQAARQFERYTGVPLTREQVERASAFSRAE